MSDGQPVPNQDQSDDPSTVAHAYTQAIHRAVGVVAASRHDEQPVHAEIVEAARRLCEAPFAGIGLCDPERAFMHTVAWSGANAADLKFLQDNPASLIWDNSVVAYSMLSGELIYHDDILKSQPQVDGKRHSTAAAEMESIRTFVVAPLMVDGTAIGCLWTYRNEVKPFTEAQVDLIRTFAGQAAVAVENARQFRELQTRLDREAATRRIWSSPTEVVHLEGYDVSRWASPGFWSSRHATFRAGFSKAAKAFGVERSVRQGGFSRSARGPCRCRRRWPKRRAPFSRRR